jgi:hypothetical protein
MVVAGRDDALAIGREGHAADHLCVPDEGGQPAARNRIPYLHQIAGTARDDTASVRRKGGIVEVLGIITESRDQMAVHGIQHARYAVLSDGEDTSAV